MKFNHSYKGFGKSPKNKKKYIHDGNFVFSVKHEKQENLIEFVDIKYNLGRRMEELEADGYLTLIANPGCSLLFDKLMEKVNVLAEKNIDQYTDSDLISDIYFVSDVYLQAFERVSQKMIKDEIYFPIPKLKNLRLRNKSVVIDRHPENNLINFS